MSEENVENKQEKSKREFAVKRKWKKWIGILIVLASLGIAGYFWNDAREANERTPEAIAERNQEETQQVVGELQTILLIEGDQEPTVARVDDPDALRSSNPDFYANAQVGDYLVLYPDRAIIYRSENRQIINIAPIVDTSDLNQQADNQESQDQSAQN